MLKIILFKVSKKIRQALKITERPHSHQNELEYFKSSQLVFIATGFILFSSLDSLAILQMNFSKQQEWLIGDTEEMALPQSDYLKEMEIFACFCDSCLTYAREVI